MTTNTAFSLPTITEPAPDAGALRDFFGFDQTELAAFLKSEFNLPAFRARQLFQWVYQRGVYDIEQMSDLGKELREKLASRISIRPPSFHTREISNDGTRKYLFEVGAGDLVESVMIKQPERMTLCVSSQVGCALGCTFCRTGTMGLKRNLTTAEIIGQFVAVRDDAKNFGDMYSNVVFMGMGEPLHNYDNVTRALRIITNSLALGIGTRKVTVSTSGLVPSLKRLCTEGPDVNIAISLNSTSDEVRSKVMPVNNRWNLSELLQTLREAPLKPRKWFTIEYVMLSGVNDTDADLERLPKILRGVKAKINLIPYNSNAGLGFSPPDENKIRSWQKRLIDRGFVCTVRWSKGKDINAACGQLKTSSERKRKERKEGSLSA